MAFKLGSIITLRKQQERGIDYSWAMRTHGPYWKIVGVRKDNSFFCNSCKHNIRNDSIFYVDEIELANLSELEQVIYGV